MAELKLSLNNTQLEILKLFSQPLNETELREIKTLLVKYLSEQLSKKIDTISKEKGYTQQDFDNWLNDENQ